MSFLGPLSRLLTLFSSSSNDDRADAPPSNGRPWPLLVALAMIVALAAIWLASKLVDKL
ncbi:MAG: hypothetical protein AAF533_09215 [Acidobacteriota bacterium]